jgi:predicted ferric reductase
MHLHHSPLIHYARSLLSDIDGSLAAREAPPMANSTSHPPETKIKPVSYTYGLIGVNVSLDNLLTYVLWYTLLLTCGIILLGRAAQMLNAHLRHISALDTDRQKYWQNDQGTLWPRFKRHFLIAPFWSKRHNREMQLSSAINFGTLPSRFHAVLLIGYVGSNIAYCSILDYGSNNRYALLAEARGRSGVLATVNMLALVLLAGRNNPLISLLRVSYDTYNLLHRWMGRIVVLESIAHTCFWGANEVLVDGWGGLGRKVQGNAFLTWGAVGTGALTFILFQSPSAVRHAFYETFLALHVIAALTGILGIYMHLKLHKIVQFSVVEAVVCLWILERSARMAWILYRNVSRRGFTTVTVEALGEACRVTIDLPRPWTPRPGAHVYLYLPKISGLQSHPFSVAWSEQHTAHSRSFDNEKLPSSNLDVENSARLRTSISLVVHKRTGMTSNLFSKARAAGGTMTLKGAVEGPYGALESLHSYGTVVLFAGGIGITHQISHIRDLIQGYNDGRVATRKIVLIWTVRLTEQLEWVRPWMDQILQMKNRRNILKILLFVTRPKSTRELVSPSATVLMYPGRPLPQVVLDKEIAERTGAMAVTVCGPGSLADSVRHAVRQRIETASIDFIEESFTW